MSIFQLIALLFSAFMIYVVRVKSRKYQLSKLEVWGWYLVWLAFAILAIFPHFLTGLAGILHFGRVFDLLVVIAFMFLTGLMIHLYFSIKELRIKLEKDVRKDAPREAKG